jgi:hypothetical protein
MKKTHKAQNRKKTNSQMNKTTRKKTTNKQKQTKEIKQKQTNTSLFPFKLSSCTTHALTHYIQY